jgi:hypothetical protein
MGENIDLEKRTIEALQRYRESLAKAEELEQEEAAARRELFKRLGRFEITSLEDHASAVRPDVVQAGQAAISRLNDVRLALSKATATLDSAYRNLAALDEALGYIPMPGTTGPDAMDAGNSPDESSGSV